MRVGVLGPLTVWVGGEAVGVGGPRPRAVLAVLVARRGRAVPADVLADVLWGDEPPRTAEHTLRTIVSRLRGVLGDAVLNQDGGYLLDLPAEDVDAGRFDALRAAGGAAELRAALELWRGPAFAGQADLAPVRGEARRLEEARSATREALAAALLAAGSAPEAVAEAEALVADEPYREGAWAVLVDGLTAAGRPADGLTAYRRAAAALDELGLEPSPVLRAAQRRALTAEPPLPSGRRAMPALYPGDADPGDADPDDADPGDADPAAVPGRAPDVPVPASSLVGRDADLQAVARLLGSAKLVTLVGPGGVGKTRLALSAARAREAVHAAGGRVVELAALSDPAAVPAAVAAGLGLSVEAGPPEAALARAGALDAVVLLDNCEHVIEAVAAVAETMASRPGPLRILATSRERLGVPGEHVHLLEPLPAAAAAALFRERARAASGARADDDEAVERLVRRLDGLPLAIEMAAARTSTLRTAELADRLDERIDTLRDPRRRGDPRHRTLGAVIAWSEALLDQDERAALEAWPVFAGAVPPADAVAVLGTDVGTLESLADRSLLVCDRSTGSTRFRMLHIVRSTMRDRAAPERAEEFRRRHAEHFAAVAAAADAELRTPSEATGVQRLDPLIAELRAAHAWARAERPGLAAALTRSLGRFAADGLHDEILGWAALLVPRLPPGPDAAAAEATVGARLALAGEFDAAGRRALRAIEQAGDDPWPRLTALEVLCDVATFRGDLAAGERYGRELTALGLRLAHPFATTVGAAGVALVLGYGGRSDEALALLAETRARVDGVLGELPPTAAGWLDYAEGEAVLDRDPPAAIAALERARALADQVGNRYLGGVVRVSLSSLRARAGDPAEAVEAFADVVTRWAVRGDHTHQLTTLRNLVDLLVRIEADDPAARLWGAVTAPGLMPSYGAERERLDAAAGVLAARLGREGFERRAAAGRPLDVDAAAAAALADLAAVQADR